LEFNAKFFFVAMILSFVSGVFHNLGSWLPLFLLPISLYPWITLGLGPVRFVFGVVLPFAVMYVLGKKVALKSIKPIMMCTFLGCWIGGVAILAVHEYILYPGVGSYSWGLILQFTLWTIWEIFSTAFSAVFFVSLAALLFAHWQKTVDK
jgi:hypothetical protein